MPPATFFNIQKFKANLNTQYVGKKIIYFKKIDSTNNYASQLEKELSNNKNDLKQKLDGTKVGGDSIEPGFLLKVAYVLQ
jgi:hypothetical protein